MSPDFGVLDAGQRYQDAGSLTASSLLTTVTASNTANTLGSYTQLIASTTFDADGLFLTLESFDLGQGYLVTIGLGAGGSEAPIIQNVPFAPRILAVGAPPAWIPVHIPAGSRLAAACQCSAGGGDRVRVQVTLASGGLVSPSAAGLVTTYGAVTATSLGTTVDTGAVANTPGAWVQLTASLTSSLAWAVLCLNAALTAAGTVPFLINVGTGSAGNEAVVVPNLFAILFGAGSCTYPQMISLPLALAAGERVAIQAQATSTTSPDRTFTAVLLGVS